MSATLVLPDDWQQIGLPLPEPVRCENLSAALSDQCSDFVDIFQLNQHEQRLGGLLIHIQEINAQIHTLGERERRFKPGRPGAGGSASMLVAATSSLVNQAASLWKRVVSTTSTGTGAGKSADEAKEESAFEPPKIHKNAEALQLEIAPEEKRLFESERLKNSHTLLTDLLSELGCWNNIVHGLMLVRESALMTGQIFSVYWRSSFEVASATSAAPMSYSSTCLRFHTAMLAHLAACMAFNLGRRCELYQNAAFRDYYYRAFQLWNEVCLRELLIFNPTGSTTFLPPEMTPQACTFLMRLTIAKLQHAATIKFIYVSHKLIEDERLNIDAIKERHTEAKLNAMALSSSVDGDKKDSLETMPSAAGRIVCVNSVRCKNSATPLRGAIRLLMQLLVLVVGPKRPCAMPPMSSPASSEVLQQQMLDVEYAICPTLSEHRVVGALSLGKSLLWLELAARTHLYLLAFMFYLAHKPDLRLARLCLDYLADVLNQSVDLGDTMQQYYRDHWKKQLLPAAEDKYKAAVSAQAFTFADSTSYPATTRELAYPLMESLLRDLDKPLFMLETVGSILLFPPAVAPPGPTLSAGPAYKLPIWSPPISFVSLGDNEEDDVHLQK